MRIIHEFVGTEEPDGQPERCRVVATRYGVRGQVEISEIDKNGRRRKHWLTVPCQFAEEIARILESAP